MTIQLMGREAKHKNIYTLSFHKIIWLIDNLTERYLKMCVSLPPPYLEDLFTRMYNLTTF